MKSFQIVVLEGMKNINVQWPTLVYIIYTYGYHISQSLGSMSYIKSVGNIVNAYVNCLGDKFSKQ